MPQPKVSFIIASYNRPQKIATCLASLCQLRYDNFEVIVVDDGSSQPYDAIVAPYQARLDVRLFRQDNAGPAVARNLGIQHATGEFAAFIDDDCEPHPDWLTTLIAHAQPNTMLGGHTHNSLIHNIYSETSQFITDMVYGHYNANPDDAQFITSNNMFIPIELLRAINGFDADFYFAEDREFCDRWRLEGFTIKYVPEAIMYHAHWLSLKRFWIQHFRYGRGAWDYRTIRAVRQSGRLQDDMKFHTNIANWRGHLRRLPLLKLARMLPLFAVWQLANAAGFFYASIIPTPKRHAD